MTKWTKWKRISAIKTKDTEWENKKCKMVKKFWAIWKNVNFFYYPVHLCQIPACLGCSNIKNFVCSFHYAYLHPKKVQVNLLNRFWRSGNTQIWLAKSMTRVGLLLLQINRPQEWEENEIFGFGVVTLVMVQPHYKMDNNRNQNLP